MEGYDLPWTPAGLALLSVINEIIEKNGGIEKMYDKVSDELSDSKYIVRKRQIEFGIKKALQYGISGPDAADLLEMTYQDYYKAMVAYKIKHHIE